jgi:membrane-bound lytic murein transglycosylase MltF
MTEKLSVSEKRTDDFTRRTMYSPALFLVFFFMCVTWFQSAPFASAAEQTKKALKRALPLTETRWTKDFDGLLEKRVIRVVIPYSRTLYYLDQGHERGLTVELVRDFERHLNQKYKKKLRGRPLTVYVTPATRDKLIESVAEGSADIAAGNLTITEGRLDQIDFVELTSGGVNEIVLTGPEDEGFDSVEDLSGSVVHVRPASSYHESLTALNDRLVVSGKPPVELVLLPDAIEDEDMMEMLNAGMFSTMVMDDWKARLWAQRLPQIKLHEKLVLRANSSNGWAIRKGSPALKAELKDFFAHARRRSLPLIRYKNLERKVKGLKNNISTQEQKKFEQLIELFETYGRRYRFDALMLVAQGYQESRLDQKARSPMGAIGIMQMLPATGAEMKVGDIKVKESNIHAGAKYLDRLVSHFFKHAAFSELDRALFAFAAYNAGPGNMRKMRREAKRRGLNSNVWFNNVEIVTADRIGLETTTYVRNIYKYYAAYKLISIQQRTRDLERQKLHSSP